MMATWSTDQSLLNAKGTAFGKPVVPLVNRYPTIASGSENKFLYFKNDVVE